MSRATPKEYARQVKAEMQKVTWPSRKEMIASTVTVFIMVIIAALFLYTADQILATVVRFILKLGM